MLRAMVLIALLATVGAASADDDDPQLAAALAKCPGAAKYARQREGLAAARKKAAQDAPAPKDPALRQRLLDMEKVDQEVRSKDFTKMSQADLKHWMEVDAANLPQIKKIVAGHGGGLPGRAEVGVDGVSAAWILVQHADADPAFQSGVLEKIAPLVKSGEVTSHEYALLTDRVLANHGKPQRYGSQLIPQEGKWVPKPMEAPEQVDQRRAAIGEMPLADYICVAGQLFGPAPASIDGKPVQSGH